MHNYSWCLASLWAPETAPTATPAANDAHSGSSSSCISRSGGWEETTTHGVWDEEEAIVPLGGYAIAHQWTDMNKAKKPPHTKGGKKNQPGTIDGLWRRSMAPAGSEFPVFSGHLG